MKSNRRDHGDSPRRREFKSGREAVNQSVETNLSGFNYGEEHDIYIYIQKIYAHAIYAKLQHWPCLASRLRTMKKLAPMFFDTRMRVIKSKNPRLYIYIYIYRTPVVQWKSRLLPSLSLQGE